MKDKRTKKHSDVAAFAFWCRRSSVIQMRNQYDDLNRRIGRGLVFHIAPSNVAVNFAFSLATGLLSGNSNIVRLPSKEFVQVDIICEAFEEVLKSYPNLSSFVNFIRYGHEKSITDELSVKCDARMIWGGDSTINEIRKSAIRPRCVDIAFADRYSIALIDADKYLEMTDKTSVARDFYNDTYLNDQNACTSPKMVIWLGKNKKAAQDEFWGNLYNYTKEHYELQGVQAVHKLNRMMAFASEYDGAKFNDNYKNLIYRINVSNISEKIFEYCGHSGFFIEYEAKNISDILPVCGERCQTLGYLGIEKHEIEQFILKYTPKGIDRAVPIGRTMEFSLIWDGYDLIKSLTRKISMI